jgi:hypothetical protein
MFATNTKDSNLMRQRYRVRHKQIRLPELEKLLRLNESRRADPGTGPEHLQDQNSRFQAAAPLLRGKRATWLQ